MPVAEKLDYVKLLKGYTKSVTVELPSQSGTPDEINRKNERALRAAGWMGQDYIITPGKAIGYYGYGTSAAKATYQREYTPEEIEANGPKLYKAKLAADKRAATQRAKNLEKLNDLQRKLGLPLTEEV